MAQASEDRQWEGMILGDIDFTCLALGEKDRAFEFLSKRLAYERKRENESGEAEALKSMGAAYESAGDKRKAAEFYRQAISLYHRRSLTTDDEYIKANVKELREVISRLEK